MKKTLLIVILSVLLISALSAGTPRNVIQKVICPGQDILSIVTNTGTTHNADYRIRAWMTERPSEILDTAPPISTMPGNLRLAKVGNGTSTPYYAAITLQIGAFGTQWEAGNHLHYEVTYLPTNQSTSWALTIPVGSSSIIITDPAQNIPPIPVYDYPQGQVVNFPDTPTGNTVLFNHGNGNGAGGTPTSSINTSYNPGFTHFISLAGSGPWNITINSTYQWIWVVGYGALSGPQASFSIPSGSDTIIEVQCGDGGDPTIPMVVNSLLVESSPSGFEIYMNGSGTGFSTPHVFTPGEAGTYALAPRTGYNWDPLEYEVPVLSTDLTISFVSQWINVNPGPAQNPTPANSTVFHINEGDSPISYTLSWQAPDGEVPTGYKLAWNGAEVVDLGNVLSWTTPTIGAGDYMWQVIPYISDPDSRDDSSLLHSKDYRGDAENCPVWTFTITTEPDHEVLERAALAQFYLATQGENWIHNTNWLSNEPLNTWYGISTANGRVSSINLSDNNLQGTVPLVSSVFSSLTELILGHNQLNGIDISALRDVTQLHSLELDHNQFNGSLPATINSLTSLRNLKINGNNFDTLPSLVGLDSLLVLCIEDNSFMFDDIEPIIGIASQTFTYSPQASVLDSVGVSVLEDINYTISSIIGGTQNSYQWYKDGSPFGTQGQITLQGVQASDSGTYTCAINSALVPELTLQRNPIHINVVPTNDPPVINLPQAINTAQNEPLAIDLSPYISDPDGDDLTISSTGSQHLNVQIQGLVVTITPATNWTGNEDITFTIDDGVIDTRHPHSTRATATDVMNVVVINPMTIDFTASNDYNNNLVANDPITAVTFVATSNQPITSWAWDFDNDGTIDSHLPTPSHYYATEGLKSVSLEISDGIHVSRLTKIDYLEVLPGVVVPPAELNQNIVWTEQGGPYNLIGEVLLNPGYSLTIEPDAQVNLLVDSLLVINGQINANGANFSSYGESGWQGLVLGSTAANSVLNSLTITGASTGITLNDCQPTLSNITLQGASSERTPTRAIVLNGASPTLSNITISGFNCGLVASNPSATATSLNMESLHFQRGSTNPASTDTAIDVTGNYIVNINNAWLSNYNIGIKIESSSRSRGRARLTNVRVIKTESTNRDNSIGYWLSNLTNATVQADSISGFNTGILINSGPTVQTNVAITNCSISRQGDIMGSEKGISLLGSSVGRIDSLSVVNYATAIEHQGQHQLHIGYNRFENCSINYHSEQNQAGVDFIRNTAWRNAQYTGANNHPAMESVSCSNLHVLSNSFHGYPTWINGANSTLTLQQNIAWSANTDPNPITLSGTSSVNASYNDIALPQGIYPGVGNINADPLFSNASTGDFSLNVYSPCIDAGDPSAPLDPDGSRADMGACTFNWVTAPLIADFYVDTSSGQHPLTVHFTDHSTRNTISREWDFNNDGSTDSTEMNPTWTYNNTGYYSVKLRVFDGQRYNIKLVPQLIQVLNTPPQISQVIPPQTIQEDSQAFSLDLANYFHDPNGDPISYSFSQSTQVVNAALNGSVLTISPSQNVSGNCQITINAVEASSSKSTQSSKQLDPNSRNSDRDQSRTTQSFIVTVTPVNDAPTITLPASYTFAEDGNLVVNMASLVNDVDSENLTINAVNSQHVFAAMNGLVATLTSSANWFGTESISFTVSDGSLSANASTNIVVTPVNDAPVITSFHPNQDELTLAPGTSQQFDVTANDVDSNISYEWWLNGSLQQGDSPSFTYLFSVVGTHQLVSKVTDGFAVAEHSWSIQVPYINSPPQITQAISNLVITEDFAPIEIDMDDYFNDPDGDPILYSFSQSTQVVNAALSGSVLTISCIPDVSGICEFSVSAEELLPNLGLTTDKQTKTITNNRDARRISQSFEVTVESVNDAPTISLLPSYQFAEDETLTLEIADCIHDVDSSNLSLSISGNQLIFCDIEGSTLHFSAEPNWYGSEQITVTVSDNRNRLSSSTITTIVVNPVNDAPQIVSYTPATPNIEVLANSSVSFSVEATDIDSQLSYRWHVNGEELAESSASCSYFFSLSGSYSVSVTVSDEGVDLTHNWEVLVPVDVDDPELIPQCTSLSPVFPNPFRGQTRISYSLKEAGYTSLNVYNTKGQLVRNLCNSMQSAAHYQLSWDGKDNSGLEVASGLYFIRMITSGETHMVKALLIK